MDDLAPGAVAAVRGSSDAHAPRLGQPRRDQGARACRNVGLLAAAPAVLLDRLTKAHAKAGRAAIVYVEYVEAVAHQVLDLHIHPLLGVPGWPAVNVEHGAAGVGRGAVEPALDRQAVVGAPAKVLGGREAAQVEACPLAEARERAGL